MLAVVRVPRVKEIVRGWERRGGITTALAVGEDAVRCPGR
jgi:hypothetical protein